MGMMRREGVAREKFQTGMYLDQRVLWVGFSHCGPFSTWLFLMQPGLAGRMRETEFEGS